MQNELFTQSFTVVGSECDPERRLTLGGLLRRAQQIATDQCTLLGLDASLYERTHTAFLLAKMAVRSIAPVREGDVVSLVTQPGAPLRAVFHRYTALRAADGTLRAEIDARWVLVDTQTRRILRRLPEGFPSVFAAVQVPELEVEVHKATELQVCGEEKATFMRCDENHHINNTVYADIIYDALPVAAALNQEWKRFAIAYHNEVVLGASFALLQGKTSEDTLYFIGKDGEKKLFEAELTLETQHRQNNYK
ncbi:MAG: thioesterase [Ruthenibacterium sp.]